MLQLLAEPPVQIYRGNCRWILQLLAEPPARNAGVIVGGCGSCLLNPLCAVTGVIIGGCCSCLLRSLVTTWHVVPRHSRVPNVREFGNVDRELELGYEQTILVCFYRVPIHVSTVISLVTLTSFTTLSARAFSSWTYECQAEVG